MKAWGYLALALVLGLGLGLEGAQAVRETKQTQAGDLCVEGTWSAISVLELQPGKVVTDLEQVRQATMKVHNLVCVPMEGLGLQDFGAGCGLSTNKTGGAGAGAGAGAGVGVETPVSILAGSGLAFVVLFPSTFTRRVHPLFANAPMPQLAFDLVLTRHREIEKGVWTGTMDRVVVGTTVFLLEASVVEALGMPKNMGGVLYLVDTAGQAAQQVLQAFPGQVRTGLGLTVANVSQFRGVAPLGFDLGEGHLAPTCVPKVLPVFRFVITDLFQPRSCQQDRPNISFAAVFGVVIFSALVFVVAVVNNDAYWLSKPRDSADHGEEAEDAIGVGALKAAGPPVSVMSRPVARGRSVSRSGSGSRPMSVFTSGSGPAARTRKQEQAQEHSHVEPEPQPEANVTADGSRIRSNL